MPSSWGKDGTVYYGRDADEQVKIASITKVMTAILTVENCKIDEKVTVSNAAATVGNSTAGLLEGDELTVEQALRGLMIPSGTTPPSCSPNMWARRST